MTTATAGQGRRLPTASESTPERDPTENNLNWSAEVRPSRLARGSVTAIPPEHVAFPFGQRGFDDHEADDDDERPGLNC